MQESVLTVNVCWFLRKDRKQKLCADGKEHFSIKHIPDFIIYATLQRDRAPQLPLPCPAPAPSTRSSIVWEKKLFLIASLLTLVCLCGACAFIVGGARENKHNFPQHSAFQVLKEWLSPFFCRAPTCSVKRGEDTQRVLRFMGNWSCWACTAACCI